MITFGDLHEPTKATDITGDKCVDPQLWLACAGGMVQMPAIHSKVFYFPQGHAEHANNPVDLSGRIPPLILCRVVSTKFMADPDTDEVFAKIRLVPVIPKTLTDRNDEDDFGLGETDTEHEKPASFAKTLTQSDANNGGGFSVPRYCAETIFPRLDYSADPPVQNVHAKDVHGTVWKFRHIYRGTPRRHLLTTGWSTFVNQKKLVAGDSIVFLRADDGDLHVGIRRAKRGFCGGHDEYWSQPPGYANLSAFLREDEGKFMRSSGNGNIGRGKVRAENVVESANAAASGQAFEVVYYPRASTPEFCVRAKAVRAAMRVQWCPGMRFKMAFETEDSSRISWFMGTISGVQVADPVRWPNSLWRLLQVTWDEPDLLQNVKRVSPWLVELVSIMPTIHLAPFSPPLKKPRIPYPEPPLEGQLVAPTFHGNPLGHAAGHRPIFPFPETTSAPAGIQGARHAQFGASLADFHFSPLQSNLLYSGFHPPFTRPAPPPPVWRLNTELTMSSSASHDDVSCSLTIGSPHSRTPQNAKKSNGDGGKTAPLVLFGKPILTEQQMTLSNSGKTASSDGSAEKTVNVSDGSGSVVIQNSPLGNSSCDGLPWFKDTRAREFGLEPGQCKVFVESDDVGRNLDLSILSSFEQLYTRLSDMFCVDKAELKNRLLYRDAAGETKHAEDEPFGDFMKSARRLTILTDAGSDNVGS